jgi:benzoyl-CoA reductase subunit C
MVSQASRIGWFCPYAPLEILLAAGAVPVHLRGEQPTLDRTERYIAGNTCLYVKHLLETGLSGQWSGLKAVVLTNSCDCMMRLRDLWAEYVDAPPLLYLEIPRKDSAAAVIYFREQLNRFVADLESLMGRTISSRDISAAMDRVNSVRALMAEVFERQKTDPPRLTGSELWSLIQQSAKLTPEEFVRAVEARPERLGDGPAKIGRPRILIAGAKSDRPELIHLVEQAGGAVVAIDDCLGLRSLEPAGNPTGDPIDDLARYYLGRIGCPRKPGGQTRLDRLAGLADDYRADGVIFSHVKFCDFNLFEGPPLRAAMNAKGVHFLDLEHDYVFSDLERLGVRVEAFVETLQGGLASEKAAEGGGS